MASFAPLFPLEKQFQAKDGRNNTGGWLKVYLAATDDPAETYSDYLGTRNPERIVLDDNGRATVICDKAKAYRLEVYDISGALLWTEEPVYCSGTGGGGVSVTRVISTDGSIGVESSTEGSVTTYDLSMAPPDSDEFLEWIKCSEEDCGASWKPVFQDGTMETEPGQGIKVHGGHLYHFTCSFTVDPDGTGVNYDTFHVNMYCGSTLVESRSFDIDSSLTDEVLCEFSHDLVPEEDSCVYFSLTIPSTCEVQGEVQAHRVYSGINAVPDTCATKQWVEDTFTYNMSGRIPYSALEYDASSQITAINGSAINGGTDTTAVSSIASTYAQSAVSGFSAWTGDMSSISSKADQSSLENCCTTMSGYVSVMSGYVSSLSSDVSALSAEISGITGATGDYVEKSAISGVSAVWNEASGVSSKLDASASGDFYSTSNPSGFITGVDLSDYATTAYVDSSVSGKVDETAYTAFTSQASSDISSISSVVSGITGDWSGKADQSALDLKLDKSASSNFYPMTGNPSGFLTEHQELSGYVEKSAISAESAQWNEVSAKADTSALTAYQPVSAMSGYQPSGDYAYNSSVSGKQDASAMSAYALSSDVSGVIDTVSANSATWAGASGDYVEKSSTEVTIGSANTAQYTSMAQGDSNLASAGFSFAQGSANTAADISLAQGVRNSAAYTSFAQGIGASAGGTSFAQGIHISARSCSFAQGQGVSASGVSFAQGEETVAVGTSVAIGHYLQAANRMVAFGKHNISGDDLALVIGDGWYMPGEDHRHNLFEVKKSGDIVLYSGSADTTGWSVKGAVATKLDASASSKFYSTSNPSGFITGVDLSNYATTAYVDSSVSGKADTSSLTAYQPSGDYAYNSSLSSYALSADVSGVIDTVSANSATWAGISDDYVAKSAISAESSVWNSASKIPGLIPRSAIKGSGGVITSINGSAILSGFYVEKSASHAKIGSGNLSITSAHPVLAQGFDNTAAIRSFVQGEYNDARSNSLAQGYHHTASSNSMAQGEHCLAFLDSFAQGSHCHAEEGSFAQGYGDTGFNKASSHSFSQGYNNSSLYYSMAQGRENSAADISMAVGSANSAISGSEALGRKNYAEFYSFAQGRFNSAKNNAVVFGQFNLKGNGDTASGHSAAFVIGDGTASGKRHDLMLVTKDGEITMFSSTADTNGTGILSSLRALSAAASSVIDSATVSAIASSYAESAASSKLDSSASSSFYPVDNPSGFITGVDLSEYATTSYVDSSVSGKLDTTAFNSGDFYSTSNPSGFITGVDLSPYQLTADMSGYIPTSESANYQQSSAMTAYQLSGDYAYNSALSGYIPTSESANYQPVSAMTAYQPSGDYIYASALGTGEI